MSSRGGPKCVWLPLIAASVLLATGLAAQQCPDGSPCPMRSVPQRSVAVLPFRNLSADPSQQYFADGISDAITDALAQLPGVKVAARSSAFAFRDRDIGVKTIADSLGVATIVEGSVLKSGNRVRVSARLIEASTGYAMWSEQVTTSETDLFELQDTVSRAIASRLGAGADGRRLVNRSTANVEAQDRYLRGKDLLYRRDPASLLAAREEFRRAIRADARFAPAWAGLSSAYSLYLVIREWPLASKTTSPDSTYGLAARALAAANRAIALDSVLPEGWAVRGYLELYASAPQADGERDLRRAIRLRPGYAEAYGWLGQLIAYNGGSAVEAMAAVTKAVELDPASIGMRLGYTSAAWAARDYVKALENARAVQTLRPEFEPITSVFEGPALTALGRAEECLRLATRPILRPLCLVGAGRREEAAVLVDSLVFDWERGGTTNYALLHLAGYYGMIAHVDQFIKWMTLAYERVPIAIGVDNGGLNDPVLRAEGGRARAAYQRLRQAAWDRVRRESLAVVLP